MMFSYELLKNPDQLIATLNKLAMRVRQLEIELDKTKKERN